MINSYDQSQLWIKLTDLYDFLVQNDWVIQQFLGEQVSQRTNHLRDRSWLYWANAVWHNTIQHTYKGCLSLIEWVIRLLISWTFSLSIPSSTTVLWPIWLNVIMPSFQELRLVWQDQFTLPLPALSSYVEKRDSDIPIISPDTMSDYSRLLLLCKLCKEQINDILHRGGSFH